MKNIYQYYVEGECEEALIKALKDPTVKMVYGGKVTVFNVIQDNITLARIRTLKDGTTIILVFDVDKGAGKLEDNIKLLLKQGYNKIICLMQNKNFEDEIIKSTDIHAIGEMYKTTSKKEFKHKFINDKTLLNHLQSHSFDIDKMWTSKNVEGFSVASPYLKSIKI